MAEFFREELRQRWDQGCHNGKQLFMEIRQRGYIGSYTGLLRLLAEWRPVLVVGDDAGKSIPAVLLMPTISACDPLPPRRSA
jgi:hypothetical protein